ncbi:MAG TPA: VOC family protein [Chloroflexota bacterium]|nr:VOC family protein [Chloroflexota bacterium]
MANVSAVLSVILSCDDPYAIAELFVERLGWRLVFATPRESEDRLACVALGDAEVMLGTAEEQFLPAAARAHRGAGVEMYVRLPASDDIAKIYARHLAAGVVTRELSRREWGELAFHAEIDGYRFLVAQAPSI